MTETVAVAGHNSVDGAALKSYVERLENLDEERRVIADDMKGVLGEAKAAGLDTKTIRSVVRLRRKERAVLDAELEMLEVYMSALGM